MEQDNMQEVFGVLENQGSAISGGGSLDADVERYEAAAALNALFDSACAGLPAAPTANISGPVYGAHPYQPIASLPPHGIHGGHPNAAAYMPARQASAPFGMPTGDLFTTNGSGQPSSPSPFPMTCGAYMAPAFGVGLMPYGIATLSGAYTGSPFNALSPVPDDGGYSQLPFGEAGAPDVNHPSTDGLSESENGDRAEMRARLHQNIAGFEWTRTKVDVKKRRQDQLVAVLRVTLGIEEGDGTRFEQELANPDSKLFAALVEAFGYTDTATAVRFSTTQLIALAFQALPSNCGTPEHIVAWLLQRMPWYKADISGQRERILKYEVDKELQEVSKNFDPSKLHPRMFEILGLDQDALNTAGMGLHAHEARIFQLPADQLDVYFEKEFYPQPEEGERASSNVCWKKLPTELWLEIFSYLELPEPLHVAESPSNDGTPRLFVEKPASDTDSRPFSYDPGSFPTVLNTRTGNKRMAMLPYLGDMIPLVKVKWWDELVTEVIFKKIRFANAFDGRFTNLLVLDGIGPEACNFLTFFNIDIKFGIAPLPETKRFVERAIRLTMVSRHMKKVVTNLFLEKMPGSCWNDHWTIPGMMLFARIRRLVEAIFELKESKWYFYQQPTAYMVALRAFLDTEIIPRMTNDTDITDDGPQHALLPEPMTKAYLQSLDVSTLRNMAKWYEGGLHKATQNGTRWDKTHFVKFLYKKQREDWEVGDGKQLMSRPCKRKATDAESDKTLKRQKVGTAASGFSSQSLFGAGPAPLGG